MKLLWLTVGVSAVAASVALIDNQSRTPTDRPASPLLPPAIFAPGRVEGATAEIELRSRLAGRIATVGVREGQWAEEGQVLLCLDDQEYQQAVALAADEVELAEAQHQRLLNGAHQKDLEEARSLCEAKQLELKLADDLLRRYLSLREERVIEQQKLDNQQTLVDRLVREVHAARAHLERLEAAARPDEVRIEQARVRAARTRLELAKVQHEYTRLRAPTRGQILQINVRVGEMAGPTAAAAAITMVDASRLQVRAFVEEMDAPRVAVGMAATITADGLPGQEFKGRVTRLSPRMGNKQLWSDQAAERLDTKTREVWIDLDQPGSLLVGLRVDVTLEQPGDCPNFRAAKMGLSPSAAKTGLSGDTAERDDAMP